MGPWAAAVAIPCNAVSVSRRGTAFAGEIEELREKEKALGIKPDLEVDAFMRASTRRGKRHNIRTDYTLRLLGLEASVLALCVSILTVNTLSNRSQIFQEKIRCCSGFWRCRAGQAL